MRTHVLHCTQGQVLATGTGIDLLGKGQYDGVCMVVRLHDDIVRPVLHRRKVNNYERSAQRLCDYTVAARENRTNHCDRAFEFWMCS